jgi:predicted  nucleic acid-binding Zn-ribbon protein
MERDVLDLIMQRLERIEKQNDTQTELLSRHQTYVDAARNAVMEQVSQVKETVQSHKAYFAILGWLGLPTFTAAIGYLFTKLGFK